MLMSFWEIQRLTREIIHLEKKAMESRNLLSKFQTYAGRLGGSSIMGVSQIAGLAPGLVSRASLFAQFSNQGSSMSAMQHLQRAKMQGLIPWTGNNLTQYQLEMSAFARFKEQALKAYKEQEMQIIHEKEAEIRMELNEIENQLKSKEAMKESLKGLLAKRTTDSVPKFGLG